MFKYLIKGLQAGFAFRLLDGYRRLSTQLLKIEAAKVYLRGVQMARLSALVLVCLGLLVGLICVGVLVFHAGLFSLLAWTVKAKALLALCLGLVYMTIGAFALRTALAEKTWIAKSGIDEMLEEITRQSRKD